VPRRFIPAPQSELSVIPITTIKPETEAFRASEDRNASRIQDRVTQPTKKGEELT
jgi:hypothetical protein